MSYPQAFTINKLYTGQSDSFKKTLTDTDVRQFAEACGDKNPIHLDDDAGKSSIFGKRIIHGILVSGLISSAIAGKLPGKGAIYLGQTLRFTQPVFIDDTITATVTVTEIDLARNLVKLNTVCTNQHGDVVITGEATVRPSSVGELA